MPYRTPPVVEDSVAPSRFGFRSVRVRFGVERFEIAAFDPDLPLGLGVLLASGFAPLLFALPSAGVAACIATVALVVASARHALVVTPRGAWLEQRTLGVVWRRRPLGRLPEIESGLVWDWSELSIRPGELGLRPALHDGERAVLLQWAPHDAARDADAARLADLARAEIERFHGA